MARADVHGDHCAHVQKSEDVAPPPPHDALCPFRGLESATPAAQAAMHSAQCASRTANSHMRRQAMAARAEHEHPTRLGDYFSTAQARIDRWRVVHRLAKS